MILAPRDQLHPPASNERGILTAQIALKNAPRSGGTHWVPKPRRCITQEQRYRGLFTDWTMYYEELHHWYRSGDGMQYHGSIKWADPRCADADPAVYSLCEPATQGIRASRVQATLSMEWQGTGNLRYTALEALRTEIAAILTGSFPYSFQFLYWEEVGIIDVELVKNLAICGLVIAIIVALLIPRPGVFFFFFFLMMMN